MATEQPCKADAAWTIQQNEQLNYAESMNLQDFRSSMQGCELRLPDLAAVEVVTLGRGNILEAWMHAPWAESGDLRSNGRRLDVDHFSPGVRPTRLAR